MRAFLFFSALSFTTVAVAQTPAFDPRSWKGQQAGPPTEVLTLGSAHLSQLAKPIQVEWLEPLLAKLAAFKPTIITHEGLTGEQCEQVRRHKTRYISIWSDYCRGTEEAEFATGLTVPEAMAEAEKILANWPAQPTAAQRRKLASVLLAAGERSSALVQWLQLPPAERKEGDGIDANLRKNLERKGEKLNETYDVAVPLAARLGLQRVYAVDDHTADGIYSTADNGIEEALNKHWSSGTPPKEFAAYEARQADLKNGEDVLDFFRIMNTPAVARAFVTFDYNRALKEPSPQHFGRQYVAWWETRNLRMVANIRAAFGNKPGARVLNVVGASHKAYYDAYLDMMHEVKLVDMEKVLK